MQITSDPDEAARAPMGDAIVADVALTLRALASALSEPSEPPGAPGSARLPEQAPGQRPDVAVDGVRRRSRSCSRRTASWCSRPPTSTTALRNQLRLSTPGSYYFSAGGGLGFGLPASLGVQLAQPERQVVCVLGEGSAQYAITAFWTAAAYEIPVKFLVLRNDEYSILKWFATMENVTGAPGLDLPSLDVAATAASYGVPARAGLRARGAARGARARRSPQSGPAPRPGRGRSPEWRSPDGGRGRCSRRTRAGSATRPAARPTTAPPTALAAGTPEPLRGELRGAARRRPRARPARST